MALDHVNFGDHLCRVYLSVSHEWSEGNLIYWYFLFGDLLKELLLDTMKNMCSWDSGKPYLYSLWGNIQCTMETLLKVTIIGAPSVGKTSYVHRYVHGSFRFYYKETMGGKCIDSWMKILFVRDLCFSSFSNRFLWHRQVLLLFSLTLCLSIHLTVDLKHHLSNSHDSYRISDIGLKFCAHGIMHSAMKQITLTLYVLIVS